MIAFRRRTALVILPILTLTGCNSPKPPAPPPERVEVREIDAAKFDSDPKPLPMVTAAVKEAPLRLTLAATPNISPDDLSLRLKVENTSREPFDWDRQFVGGLEWRVAVSDGGEFIAPEVLELDKGRTAKRERAHFKILPDAVRYPWLPDRFERLDPGQSMTAEFKLQGLGSPMNKVEVDRDRKVLRQEYTTFSLPPEAKLVRVQVRYSPTHATLRQLQKREELKLPPAVESNALEVSWK